MEQHPIPRQITTFEFKLIGFMTLKQFIYLVVFIPIAYIVIRLFPIPVLNFILGAAIAGFGIALAFLPVNDRPLDVFLKNLYKRITSPTQYVYQKKNDAIYFLTDSAQMEDPQKTSAHIESQQKLANYLDQAKQKFQEDEEKILDQRKEKINTILSSPQEKVEKKEVLPSESTPDENKPFIVGVVKNNKKMPLPGVLLYIKDQKNTPIRLLKTNPHGVFATYSRLPPGEYKVEIKDPKDTFFFDTMKIQLDTNNPRPLEFYSREII